MEKILVEWRDSIQNYSKDKQKQIEKYFRDKYDTRYIKVDFKPIKGLSSDSLKEVRVQSSENIYEQDYQKQLIERYLKDAEVTADMDLILRLDNKVEEVLNFSKSNVVDKTFKINWLTANNFLSFAAQDNVLPLNELHGVNAVKSNPDNYGGKTTITVDALLFLFFGKTTKTSTLEETFNLFTDVNKLKVSGSITIDNDEYIIEREIVRRPTREGGYTTKSRLEYHQPLPQGGSRSLNGEERQATDKIIQETVGTYDDFLLTIVATQRSLDDIIHTKPTERGRIFNRFVGLDYFEQKAEIAKKQYKDWRDKSILNRNTVDELNERLQNEQNNLKLNEDLLNGLKKDIEVLDNDIAEKKTQIKDTQSKIYNDINQDLLIRSEEEVEAGIKKLENTILLKEAEIKTLENNLNKPTEEYDLVEYNGIREEISEANTAKNTKQANLMYQKNILVDLNNFKTCPHCNKPLTEVDTDKISLTETQIKTLETEIAKLTTEIVELEKEKVEYEALKTLWDTYNNALTIVDKNRLELDNIKASKTRGEELLANIRSNKSKIQQNKENLTIITSLETDLSILEQKKSTKTMDLGMSTSTIDGIHKSISNINESIDKIKQETKIDNIYQLYIKLYGKNGISKMVLATLIPMINDYLELLMGDTLEFKLELDLNDKNELEYIVIDKENPDKVRKLKSTSGCELTISALALRVVLAKICALPKPNMVVFDEAFGRVAEVNLPEIGNFLQKVKNYFDIIMVTEHRPFIMEYADNIITVEKNNKTSKLLINR